MELILGVPSIRWKPFLLFVLSVVLLVFPPTCNAKSPRIKTLVLTQNHCAIGDFVVTTTANAVRLDAITNGYSIVSKAPKWDVFVVAKRSRKYYTCTLEKWTKGGHIQTLASNANSEVYVGFPWSTLEVAPTKFCGVVADSRVYVNKRAGPKRTKREIGLGIPEVSTPVKRYQFIVLNDKSVANSKRDMVLRTVYLMPAVPGIPLAFLLHRVDATTAAIFTTSKIEYESKEAFIFDLPAGYSRTDKYAEVTTGSENMDEVKDLFKE